MLDEKTYIEVKGQTETLRFKMLKVSFHPSEKYHDFFSSLCSFPPASLMPSSPWSTLWHWDAERGMPEFLSLLWQREAEWNTAELADMGDGVSTSLSGPELELGDGGGREEETEGWKRRDFLCKVWSLPAAGVFILWFCSGCVYVYLQGDTGLVGLLFDFSQSSFKSRGFLSHLQGCPQQPGGLRPNRSSWGLRGTLSFLFGLWLLSLCKHLPVVETITRRHSSDSRQACKQSSDTDIL